MKLNLERSEPTFQPLTLSITFESKDELDAYKTLMGFDVTIPEVLSKQGYINPKCTEIIERIMSNIHGKLAYKKA